jgi:Ca2+-binding EF-hand superfamily protein
MESTFYKCDTEKQGYLTVAEIYEMFNKNGMRVTIEQVRKVVNTLDPANSDTLDLAKLKIFGKSPKAKLMFRNFVSKLRQEL